MGVGEGAPLFSGSASVAVLTPEPLSCPRAACTPVTLQFSLPPASFARVVSASTLTALQPATCPLSTSSETGTLLQVLGQILWAAWGLGRSAPYPGTIWREEEVRATSYPLQLERPGQWKKARTPDAAPGLSTVPLLTSPPGFCLGRMASRVVFRHRWRPRPPAPDPGVTVKLAGTERACPSLRGPARPRVPGPEPGGRGRVGPGCLKILTAAKKQQGTGVTRLPPRLGPDRGQRKRTPGRPHC